MGLQASYDDLQTEDSASASLKKQNGTYSELQEIMVLHLIKETRLLCQQVDLFFPLDKVIPIVADKAFITNTISSSIYKSLSENIIGSAKIYLASINGLAVMTLE